MVNIAQTNPTAAVPSLPTDKPTGYLEVVTLFDAPMPIGVVVSKEGRIFISYPRLVDEQMPDEQVAATVIDHGEKGTSGGMVADAKNHLYVTNYENNAILRRLPDGTLETFAHNPRMLWPNCLFVAQDGYLYLTVDQWNRNPTYHNGQDLREKPYVLFRIQIDAKPVLLEQRQSDV